MAINVDDFDRAAIRATVPGMYEKKEYPTLDRLLINVRAKGVFEGGRTTLSRVLKLIGFKFALRNDKKFFYERKDIVEQRHKFLREIRKFRSEGRPLVFPDKTWVNSHVAPERIWIDKDGSGGWKRPSGRGRRLIILHAGNLSDSYLYTG